MSRALGLIATAILVFALTGCDFPGRGSSDDSGGSSTAEALGLNGMPSVNGWAARQGFADDPKAVAGARVFAQVGCLSCHTYLGTGSSNLGAPDLSSAGQESGRSAEQFAAYISDPSRFGNDVMPRFADLGQARLLELGTFLAASKRAR